MANIEQVDKKKAILIGGALGLGTMVALTPVVMKKVMDRGLERKLALLEERGIQLQLKEDRSGYLISDKVYRFQFNWEGNLLTGELELRYYNLPVTTVQFTGKGEQIEGPGAQWFNPLWSQLRIEGESGDLNHFQYRVLPMAGEGWKVSEMDGNLYLSKGEVKNQLTGGEIGAYWGEGDQKGWFKIYNFTSTTDYRPKTQTSQFKGNIEGKFEGFHLLIPNLTLNTLWSGGLKSLNLDWEVVVPQLQLQQQQQSWVLKEGYLGVVIKNLPAQLLLGGELDPSTLSTLTGEVEVKVGDLYQTGQELGGGQLKVKLTPTHQLKTGFFPFALPFQIQLDYTGAPLFTQQVVAPLLPLLSPSFATNSPLVSDGNRVALHLKIDLSTGEVSVVR